MGVNNTILRLEAPKIIQKVIDVDGTKYCMVKRQGFFEHRLAIRKATWEEIGKLMGWKLK